MRGVRRADYGSGVEAEERYDPEQPRDEHGQWSSNDAGSGPGGSGVVVRRPGVGTVARPHALSGGRVPNAVVKDAGFGKMKVLGLHLPSAHSMTRGELTTHMSSGHDHQPQQSDTTRDLLVTHDLMHTRPGPVPHSHASRSDLL